jgi:hypothetical protein
MPPEDSDRVDGLRIEPHFRYRDNDHNATVTERLRSLRRALFGTFECRVCGGKGWNYREGATTRFEMCAVCEGRGR